ncbi:MAG: DNRLRE domain-containing protein [Caldilineaceae bacterium]
MLRLRRNALFAGLLAAFVVPLIMLAYTASAATTTYYISPQGDDNNDGTSAAVPWQTFGHAWEVLEPGDTLVLLDGTYKGPTTGVIQPNIRNGEPGKPITIKALNDGKAVIDGDGQDIPVRLGENWGPSGAIGNWFVVEGLVARNGTLSNFRIEHGNNNVLRRISAYNASVDENAHAISIVWSDNNLVEDFIAAGTGRYMANVFTSNGNTLRRGFTMWQQWDGRHFCGVSWPNGNNVGVYNSSNTTVENVIAYGRALTGIFIQANDDSAVADNNQVLGSMALLQGADYDGSPWTYGTGERQPTARPGPITNPYGEPCPDNITQWEWGGHRQGFNLYGQGELHDNVFRDILATGNVGLGWASQHPYGPGPVGAVIDHATIYGNGSDITGWESVQGGDIYIDRRDQVLSNGGLTVTNSRIANSQWANQGEGARFQYRYVDRQLTNQPLLPWPMEARAQSEVGVSVNTLVSSVVSQSGGTFPTIPTPVGPVPAVPSPTPSATASPTATPTPRSPAGYRVNAPLYAVDSGDTLLDANNWSVVWFGQVSSSPDNYGDLRVVGRTDGILLRAQLFDSRATTGDSVTIVLNGVSKQVAYGAANGAGWEVSERCTNGICRGWSADGFFPWSEFGGRPVAGAVWPLRVVFDDADADGITSQSQWPPNGAPGGTGTLRWGLPDYGGHSTADALTLEVALGGDSMLGGSTDCGDADYPDYFPTWGSRNFGQSNHVNVQMQWDVADWPCYAKYYAGWSLGELPAGAQVISATVELRQFGNPGFSPGYADDGTKDTVMQVFEVNKPWVEDTITWDNAPLPQENTSRTLVQPLPGDCAPTPYWYCSPGIPYQLDVTEIVRRAQAEGRNWASLALYTAAGQYHSGKYFYSREGAEPPIVRMAYVFGSTPDLQPLPDTQVKLFMPHIKGGQK